MYSFFSSYPSRSPPANSFQKNVPGFSRYLLPGGEVAQSWERHNREAHHFPASSGTPRMGTECLSKPVTLFFPEKSFGPAHRFATLLHTPFMSRSFRESHFNACSGRNTPKRSSRIVPHHHRKPASCLTYPDPGFPQPCHAPPPNTPPPPPTAPPRTPPSYENPAETPPLTTAPPQHPPHPEPPA